jgi:hypothetical protein
MFSNVFTVIISEKRTRVSRDQSDLRSEIEVRREDNKVFSHDAAIVRIRCWNIGQKLGESERAAASTEEVARGKDAHLF